MATGELSSNWKKLQKTLTKTSSVEPTPSKNGTKRKRESTLKARVGAGKLPQSRQAAIKRDLKRKKSMASGVSQVQRKTTILEVESSNDTQRLRVEPPSAVLVNAGLSHHVELGRYVAIDCEMVGVGPNPARESALARVSLVNYNGEQVYDSYVLSKEPVTDWRTHVSGIRPEHMAEARSLEHVQAEVSKIITGRILVGHAIHHDLEAMMLSHPKRDIRDTSRHPPYRKWAGGSWPALKILTSELLGFEIQDGAHSSVEDARACMLLFRKDKASFEKEHSRRWPAPPAPAPAPESESPAPDNQSHPARSKKKKKKKRH
ncbi:hypothetical protein, variant [Exophiala mesophila]|uniref:RNA exonuclease 4 n=1 Tax=Exophiala mesophila TaxID=212818 RepID=A0A0D1XZF5_EXOME|nr:uncharacterized protein PV10_04839 [Exophiala mesophila]XP_016225216.1 hypothetical protein, variant [Exophiala mesophila]KIV93641.1 hypothetical protein PV10_04839 [Exophiala mesophila]KIV93642.1 hypothetical protein, variant [Exophiala mesophila]